MAVTLLVAACSGPSESAVVDEQSQSSQSGGDGTVDEDAPEWDDTVRPAQYPLVPQEAKGIPFRIWAPQGAIGEYTQVLTETSAKNDPDKAIDLGAAAGVEPPNVLTLLTEGSGFGMGIDEQSSLPEVGIITPEDGFNSLSALTGIAAANYLADGVPYQTLGAFAADSSEQTVVWLAKDETNELWSLMSWGREEGTLQELASSASLSSETDDSGVQMDTIPTLSTNGRYVLFSASVPRALLDLATPGSSLSQDELLEGARDDRDSALFRVASNAPGEVMFLGGSLIAQADPVYTRGMFTVSRGDATIPAPNDFAQSDAAQAQSGEWRMDWDVFCDASEGKECDASPVRPVLWTDGETVDPIFAIEDGDVWNAASMSVSERYLVVSVESNGSGSEADAATRPEAWLLIWDLEATKLLAAVDTGDAVVSDSGHELVVWGGEVQATDENDELAQSGPVTESVAYLFEPSQNEGELGMLYSLPAGPVDAGPKVSGDILAVRTLDDELAPNWTFLQWK